MKEGSFLAGEIRGTGQSRRTGNGGSGDRPAGQETAEQNT